MRRTLPIVLAAVWLVALAAPAAAAPGGSAGTSGSVTADHITGSLTACGRIVEFTAPVIGTDGSLTVSGIVGTEDHAFVIDDTATVSPLVTTLAVSGDWTCLALTADGSGVLVDVNVAGAVVCAPLAIESGTFVLGTGSTDPFTTVVLDGDAGALIAADADLSSFFDAIANTPGAAEVCLEFGLAADGTLASILLDYAEAPGVDLPARIACGMVNGTPIPYRDPASQPYPEGDTVSVAGFAIDASLLPAPYQEVLAFHLDAVAEICLLVQIEDNVIVDAAALSLGPAEVCGELEVVGGLVFVDTVVVSQGLTGINFAEPQSASIDLACWSARAQIASVGAEVLICGDFQAATDTTFTVSDVTFNLETAVDDSDLPPVGGPQTVAVIGPDPFEPFGAGNPTRVTTATMAGCAGASPSPLPDTSADAPAATALAAPMALLAVLWLVGAIGLATVVVRRR